MKKLIPKFPSRRIGPIHAPSTTYSLLKMAAELIVQKNAGNDGRTPATAMMTSGPTSSPAGKQPDRPLVNEYCPSKPSARLRTQPEQVKSVERKRSGEDGSGY